ncbi:hypothetical protein P3S67_030326 [Capsicum chacoense]
MDQTKNQENESLKQEIRRLRQQMTDMHRAWTLAPQHKPSTFTTPHVVCDLVSQSSSGTSTLGCPTTVRPHAASEPIFNTLSGHCYTPEPAFKLTGPPKFLNKKFSVPEESEKMVEKMKSAENAMKNSLGPAGKKDISYKDWGMPSSANLPPIFEMLKFEKQDGHEECVKHLGQYCNQLRKPEGNKNEKYNTAIVVGERAHPRRRHHRCRQSQAQILAQRGMITLLLGYTPDPHSRSFDPNVRYAYHSDVQGHSIEDCRALKREIKKMIQDKLIMVQNIDNEENFSHADMQTSD